MAEARGTTRTLETVRIRRRSIAPPLEDPVTLAVNAALPLVEAAGRDAYELLIVATESGIDFGKPLSSYVHRHLGLGSRCRNLEVKHACYGGTASLQLALSWLRSGAAPGKKALVITTDLPGNQFGEPAELTPGTGAVALSLAAEPRVLELAMEAGYASREVYDTARPTATGHWVNEVLSLAAYLDLLELAYEHYRSQRPGRLHDDFDHIVYHMPVETLVLKAHAALLEVDDPDVDQGAVAASFERMVRPALHYCGEIGNIFSGTLYAGLASLIDSATAPAAGTRVGLYSYGSGSCGEFFAGTVMAAARTTLAEHGIAARLARRRALTLDEYETIVRDREGVANLADWSPRRDLPGGHFDDAYAGSGRLVLDSVKDFYRRYVWSR